MLFLTGGGGGLRRGLVSDRGREDAANGDSVCTCKNCGSCEMYVDDAEVFITFVDRPLLLKLVTFRLLKPHEPDKRLVSVVIKD